MYQQRPLSYHNFKIYPASSGRRNLGLLFTVLTSQFSKQGEDPDLTWPLMTWVCLVDHPTHYFRHQFQKCYSLMPSAQFLVSCKLFLFIIIISKHSVLLASFIMSINDIPTVEYKCNLTNALFHLDSLCGLYCPHMTAVHASLHDKTAVPCTCSHPSPINFLLMHP